MTVTLPAAGLSAPPGQTLDRKLREIASGLETGLGLKPQDLSAIEERDSLALWKEGWSPTQLSPVEALALIALCGEALEITVRSGGQVISAFTTSTTLQNLKSLVANPARLTLALTLDKSRLLEILEVQPRHASVLLFLYGDALVGQLEVPLASLEGKGKLLEHAGGERKTVILLADRDISLDGDYFALAGGRFLVDWKSYCPASPTAASPIRDLQARALDPHSSLSWIGFTLSYLTPLQLRVEWKDGPGAQTADTAQATPPWGDPVVQALYRKRIELALAFTANQIKETRQDGRWNWLCTYQRESSSGQIRLDGGPDPSMANVAKSLPAAAKILDELAVWAYAREDRESDRLPILRNVFADAFAGRRPEISYRLLLEDTDRLDRDVKGGWRSFVDGKLEEYFDRVRQLEDLVDTTVQSFQGQIQTLIKGLSESMLAGVGVVVGSFLAAMFAPGFNAEVFRLGVLLYALYLTIFPAVLGLTSTRQQARDAAAAFRLRVQSFRNRLSESVVDEITKQGQIAQGAIARFDIWLAVAGGIYAVTVLALLLGAWLVPGSVLAP